MYDIRYWFLAWIAYAVSGSALVIVSFPMLRLTHWAHTTRAREWILVAAFALGVMSLVASVVLFGVFVVVACYDFAVQNKML